MKQLKKEVETDVLYVAVNIIHLNINGVINHYMSKVWVDDENNPDGGSYQFVKKMYKTPRIKIDFLANVDIQLDIDCIYSDGINNFIPVSKHQIKNYGDNVEIFKIPKKLICIYKPYRRYQIENVN